MKHAFSMAKTDWFSQSEGVLFSNLKQEIYLKKDRRCNLEIDFFSMVSINAIRVRLAVAVFVNSVFINVQANMAAGAR